MSALFVAARAVQFASAMLLFGGLVFVFGVAQPAWRQTGHAVLKDRRVARRRLAAVALACIVAGIVSAAVWLVCATATMTGSSLEQAMQRDALSLVLGKTVFGRVWVLRFGLALLLGLMVLVIARSNEGKRASTLAIGAIAVAGAYLGSLAWAGHAAAGQGADRIIQLVGDIVHLIASGAWLGALPGLLLLLARKQPPAVAAQATRRFSALGVVSVGALLVTGIANTWYLVHDVPALIGTDYGQVLLLKIALFLAMLMLAATNRWRLTPRLSSHNSIAQQWLKRNALVETVAGVVIVIIVGVLGIMVPAVHQAPVWPFNYTLSTMGLQGAPGVRAAVFVVGVTAAFCAIVVSAGVWKRRRRLSLFGAAGLVVASALGASLLVAPAYPTSYAASPVRYDVRAIAHGAVLYAGSCATCHGSEGHGDGPSAAGLSPKPANLSEHAAHHHAGDLFWLIAHGKPQSAMPGFSPAMSDVEIWEMIQFIDALTVADSAASLTNDVQSLRRIVPPNFTFELPARGQETLYDQRGRFATLLVFYTSSQSLPYLRRLAQAEGSLTAAGVRVLAIPIDGSAPAPEAEGAHEVEPMFARAGRDVVTAYMMLARVADDPKRPPPSEAEFLIDRQGYLRARWVGAADAGSDRLAELQRQAEFLKQEAAHPSAPPERHGH